MRFAVQHATQRSTAQARTEMLTRGTRLEGKQLIAARTPTRPPHKIFLSHGWALALARRRQHRCAGRISSCARSAHQPLAATLPITPTLLPPTLLPPWRCTPTPAGLPTPPPPRRLPAGHAAKTALRTRGLIKLLTSLQQTAPLPVMRSALLSWTRLGRILKWAHGSSQLPGSSLGGEPLARLRGVLFGPSVSSIATAAKTGQEKAWPR